MILPSYKNYILRVYRYKYMPYSVYMWIYLYHTYPPTYVYIYVYFNMYILIIYVKETLHWMELNGPGRLYFRLLP